ncbi:hypothetical protein SMD20_40255 [Nonomuraea sp. LP-02]|uniref:hypothetical protein n=1 Tax=Nonomuraea sp. LP-02 TaxID=3097960 RepID=UPI002E362CE4|nr:hypothetical protein [Nonomuraea sp. LP-02]MED7930514.1 hypothetical protein [Nonomuraea sp. LP-02]
MSSQRRRQEIDTPSHGSRIAGGKPQVTLSESIANLHELRRIAAERTRARWTWLTPVPVDENRAA